MMLSADQIKNFFKYLDKYKEEYPEEAYKYITSYYNTDSEMAEADILRQIYTYIGAFSDDKNIYKGYFDLLKEDFDLNQDILEIAGGFFPILSKYIDEHQNGKGSITVYDPMLVTSKLGNVKLIKDKFTYDTDTSKYNVMCSFAPCKSTEVVVRKALSDKKDFSIALCGCTHFERPTYMPTVSSWENYIYGIIKENKDPYCNVEVKRLAKKYDYPYAVFVGKHK